MDAVNLIRHLFFNFNHKMVYNREAIISLILMNNISYVIMIF